MWRAAAKNGITGKGIGRKHDRRNAFRIRRFRNDHGFEVYSLENTAEGRKIYIPRFIFGRFRAAVRQLLTTEICKKSPESFEVKASFLNREYFYFISSSADIDNLVIQDVEEREGSSGYLTVARPSLHVLDALLYDEALQHPNDVLQEIISYHRLFQFSFVKGSKSITSGLALRKDVLQSSKHYARRLAERVVIDPEARHVEASAAIPAVVGLPGIPQTTTERYEPKLGERFNEKDIRVDYDEIFGDSRDAQDAANDDAADSSSSSRRSKKPLSEFPIPLETEHVKALGDGRFYFELGVEKASEFRERFIGDRSSDYYLGFEIVDALFRERGAVRTFQFPLYYCKVTIRESGRGVHVEIARDGQFWLNHLALAELVSKFSTTAVGTDHVDEFFQTLLAQDISIDRLNDRIRLVRHLPVTEAIFDRSREILLGYRDENGKGGLLGGLKVEGIECDLQSVVLYRAPKTLNAIGQALEADLDGIAAIAHDSTKRFYDSLLGKFLTPEMASVGRAPKAFAPRTWMPGAVPPSTRDLVDRLNQHELVLLEGPPGTGKTHAIMNLLLHCIATKQRVLIVSDQQAAIEALVEKMQEYLVGDDAGGPAERAWKGLLKAAIKIVEEVDEGEHSLSELVANLEDALKVPDPGPATQSKGERIVRQVRAIDDRIDRARTRISEKMHGHMGDDVRFDFRVQQKDEARIELDSLLEFLGLLRDDSAPAREALDGFVRHRFELIAQGMEDCYGFFRPPTSNPDAEIASLDGDEAMLSALLAGKPRTVEAFQTIVSDYPRHELIRYLEALIQKRVPPDASGFRGFLIRVRALLRLPLKSETRMLLGIVRNQKALLELLAGQSDGLWAMLREVHQTIRIGEEPTRALSLYRSITGKSGSSTNIDRRKGAAVQGDLEEIDDLLKQRDKLVRQRVVGNLREIARSATASRSRSGTNAITSILAMADGLKQYKSIAESGSAFDEFRKKVYDTFPIWVMRKQAVPFLLPCTERSFDLVIVDEATQCRVDDAMSLMFRADKMLVVGDDRQTVLQKRSVIDDYLFRDHDLDEHLRETQARGFKGGGSHIFALVKAIKQASVMLDEHYRCPADIIEFSNKYVYDNGLNVMQWRLPETPPAVVVDYSERRRRSSEKATRGKFKGIETQMVDRFFDYVARTIEEIEADTGKRINVESDVALCYFLLKNEPYVKAEKDRFLRALDRGEDILDGAGAALQGKERDYIFYLWDVTRYNMRSFRQGDDADQRKGELNVLMSRPKKKAFHYLHRGFEELEHGRSNITDFLWRTHARQEKAAAVAEGPLDVLDESLLGALLRFTTERTDSRGMQDVRQGLKRRVAFRTDIQVGDASRVVDLIAFPRRKSDKVIGLVDLSGFGTEHQVEQLIFDYYFQLKRVSPHIDPVFVFPHELVDENCPAFRSLVARLEGIV